MRAIGRAAGRVTRGLLWAIKGLLLLVAVGVLVMWPISSGAWIGVVGERFETTGSGMLRRWLSVDCDDGYVSIRTRRIDCRRGDALDYAQRRAAGQYGRWLWEAHRRRLGVFSYHRPPRLNPIYWDFESGQTSEARIENREVAAPCWLVACAAGAWPLTSLTLLLRRRRRQRRDLLAGRCPQCGYDCRATADPAGPRLPRCPECGAAVPPLAGA